MKKIRGIMALLLCFSLWMMMSLPSSYAATQVKVKPGVRYQDFNGWGTSLAWWGNAIGLWEDAEEKSSMMDLLFDKDLGLGLNIVRYNIGGGENPTHEHMRDKAEIEGYQPSEGVWDWNADASQRWILQEAINRGVDTYEAFSNAPPYWMTYSQCAAGSHDGHNNLKDEYYDDFAEYIAEVLKHFHDEWGIDFHTVTPLNEPNSYWWKSSNNQEGCHFDRDKQNRILSELKGKLQEKGLNTKLSGPEEYSIDATIDSYYAYDTSVRESMAQINTHTYSGSNRIGLLGAGLAEDKEVWVSEVGAGGSASHNHNDLTSALDLADKITQDMRELQPDAWVYWQVVEDEAGNHNWGLIHANFSGSEDYWVTKQYYAMANYSKFIRPGSYMMDVNNDQMIASYHPETGDLTLVVKNTGNWNKSYTIDLTDFDSLGSVEAYRTSATENLSTLSGVSVSNKTLSMSAKKNSITTYVIKNVTHSKEPSYDRDSYYKIVNKNSGKVLDVSGGSQSAGANVLQWEYSGDDNQLWRLVEVREGIYYLINKKGQMMLDINNASDDNGASAIQWVSNGGNNQLWTIEDRGNGYVSLTCTGSNKALDVLDGSTNNGGDVIQWEYWGGDNQQWTIQKVQ